MLFRIKGKPLRVGSQSAEMNAKSGMVQKVKGLLVVFSFAFAELWTKSSKSLLQMRTVAETRTCVYS